MKILYLITRAERGGAQVHLLDLIRGFRQRCEIEVAAGEQGFLLDEARRLGVKCHILPSLVQPIAPAKDVLAFRQIVGLIRRTRPDLVHAHTSKAGILGRLSAWICNVPAVFTAHTWCFAEGTSWTWKLLGGPSERFAARLGGSIINVSEANRALALQYRVAPPARLFTIHNGISDDPAESGAVRREAPAIIMVARFAAQKDQALLLHACARLTSPFHLQFAGAGPTRPDAERIAKELGLTARVEFLGDRSDVADRLRQASIFALATHWEGFPLSILEAMRAGLPVVACDVGGVREAVVDGQNGFLVARGDTEGFARALETLLNDEPLRARLARNSRRMFEERFTVEHMLRKTFSVYGQTVSLPAGEYEISRASGSA
jgi:glycosyltransferase involved in cell wall biosynthesis